MSQVLTTTPNAPVGQITPEVPLGISASLTQIVSPLEYPPLRSSTGGLNEWNYIDSFTIEAKNPVGKFLWSWDSYDPFKSKTKNKFMENNNQVIPYLFKNMALPYWAQYLNMEYILRFEPVKVTDSRVEIFVEKNYDGRADQNNIAFGDASTSSYNQENEIFTFDSPDEVKLIKPTLFQAQSKMPNNAGLIHEVDKPIEKLWPTFLPTTTISLKQQSRFINNALQPDTFDVNVYIMPIIRTMSQLNSKLPVMNFGDTDAYNLTYVPYPWWMAVPINPSYDTFKANYPDVELKSTVKEVRKVVKEFVKKGTYTAKAIVTYMVENYVK